MHHHHHHTTLPTNNNTHSSLVPKDQALFFDAIADNILTGRRDDLSLVAKVLIYLYF